MAKTSKDKRIHPGFKVADIVNEDGTEFYLYQCTRCNGKVRNGQPFSQVKMEECNAK